MTTSNEFTKLIVFDCDSTLSAIEGIDELGALRGDAIKAKVAALTEQAMDGVIAIDEVFGRRMDLIRPTREECASIGQAYVERVEPTAKAVVEELRSNGWRVVILSGGFAPVIAPLAEYLGIERVEAVPLSFEDDGGYLDFGRDYPTTRNGGKAEIVEALKAEYGPQRVVVVGDGVSDLETKSVVDLFVGFGRYAVRKKVKSGADAFICSLDQLPPLLSGAATTGVAKSRSEPL